MRKKKKKKRKRKKKKKKKERLKMNNKELEGLEDFPNSFNIMNP